MKFSFYILCVKSGDVYLISLIFYESGGLFSLKIGKKSLNRVIAFKFGTGLAPSHISAHCWWTNITKVSSLKNRRNISLKKTGVRNNR